MKEQLSKNIGEALKNMNGNHLAALGIVTLGLLYLFCNNVMEHKYTFETGETSLRPQFNEVKAVEVQNTNTEGNVDSNKE